MKMSNKLYDLLNGTVKIVLPAIGTLYFALASVWGLPYGDQVVGSLAAFATFLGVVLSYSKKAWSKTLDGALVIDESDSEKDVWSLELDTPLEELSDSASVSLKIIKK